MKRAAPNPHGKHGKPISLADYSFEDAVRKILQATPEPKPERKPTQKLPKKTKSKK